MLEFIAGLIERLGYIGVALLMFIETLIPPIPSELIMPLVGVAAAEGRLDIFGATAAAIAGATFGATAWYVAARAFGAERLLALADRHGCWLRLNGAVMREPAAWFAKRGGWAVFAARILPGMRVYISVPAGLSGMPLGRFLGFTIAGYTVWYGLLGAAGYVLGLNVDRLIELLSIAAPWLWAALVALVAWRLSAARRVARVVP